MSRGSASIERLLCVGFDCGLRERTRSPLDGACRTLANLGSSPFGVIAPRMGGAENVSVDQECVFTRRKGNPMETIWSETALIMVLLLVVFLSGKA